MIISLEALRAKATAKNLEPYYLDLCEQARLKRVALFRCIGRKVEEGELERMRIEMDVLDRKISEVSKMIGEAK